ncbi:hypothetical protein EIP91_010381 [Steccherinum ochraceum]|uniref:Uncharacterized protein n=1 Tax=Steccherinum ochraceum TaxID=92696 RepID=A0A4R0RN31_9APHY|nr:hypothetical protein EIP91_010381 [Steccherinum ochraceum]
MLFSKALLTALPAILFGGANAAIIRRDTLIFLPFETIVAPADGTAIVGGQSFNLNYPVSVFGRCPSSLYGLRLFVLDHVPTDADVNANFSDHLFQFGNFWLGWTAPGKSDQTPPNIPNLPPLPSNFTMPELSIGDTTVYFVVVQDMSCVPNIPGVGVSYSAIEYSDAAATKRDIDALL